MPSVKGIFRPLCLIPGDGRRCLLGRYPLSVLEGTSYKLCQLLLIHGVTPPPCHSFLSSLILNSSRLSYSSNFSQSSVSIGILCNQIFTLISECLLSPLHVRPWLPLPSAPAWRCEALCRVAPSRGPLRTALPPPCVLFCACLHAALPDSRVLSVPFV